jgi:hypothetical protein
MTADWRKPIEMRRDLPPVDVGGVGQRPADFSALSAATLVALFGAAGACIVIIAKAI